MKGRIHSFESLAALDGEGLRYAVFLAGCPLRCAYCHNPDTWNPACGRECEAGELMRKLTRYKPYFGERGGVTFSGGEPLLQVEFLAELIPLLQTEGVGYIVDTSGAVPLTDTVKAVLAGAQSVLLDLKFWDEESYRRYTGKGITQTLATLAYLNGIGKPTRIRIVVVPGINDREEILSQYLAHLKGITCVTQVELLAFHTMGFFKYGELGVPNPLADTPALDPHIKDRLQRFVDAELKRSTQGGRL